MTVSDFAAFYHAVHGYPPFPWQERLLERVVDKGWPGVIALPTSSGKTSAIDVAVFHLALEAGKQALERRAPLRIFFVIDRRVVVDEAAEHALKLARALLDSDTEIVKSVAQALRTFGAKYPLDVAVLRGGMYRDNTWADEPNQPLVCVSTVDQVGSRLLFRGYQVGELARSVHAALVGNDSLIIVDEAHLSAPFLDTLAGVGRNCGGERSIASGITLVKMSATLDPSAEPFELDTADNANAVLSRRLLASKPTELREPDKSFEAELVKAANELLALAGVSVVGIVVNTVAVARAVFEGLKKQADSEAILLTGRNRPYFSQRLWEKYKDRIAAKENRLPGGPLFVVATQTVEVGANIDFDAMVCESAPLDALRQRFGRLNRLGGKTESRAILVRRPKEDPVYGERTGKTWDFLRGLRQVDFGVSAMNASLEGIDPTDLNTEAKRGPFAFPTYFEMWAQTNPAPDPDPDVAPFLHGKDALDDADVQLVWRQDLLEGGSPTEWRDAVDVAPPVSSESLALPIGSFRKWLRGDFKLNVSDVEGAQAEEEDPRKDPRKTAKPILIWRGKTERPPLTSAALIRPGDIVALPATYGGCDEFGWHPSSDEAVTDIGDEANNEMAAAGMRPYRIRLPLFAQTLIGERKSEFLALCERVRNPKEKESVDEDDPRELIAKFLTEISFPGKTRIDSSARIATWPRTNPISKIRLQMKPEDQDDDSVGVQREISLRKHTEGVVARTRQYVSCCGLGQDLVNDLVLSAKLHDLGKWDDRFQAWLRGTFHGNRHGYIEPLAKSGGQVTMAERRQAQERAGYPKGARHESASVLVACASGALAEGRDQDLVLHLIGTHHGYGRPLLPFWDEDENETVATELEGKVLETGTGRHLARFDSGWVDRFWRLNQRYGYWGLAYLETILRRADCVQSREEQTAE